MRIAIADNDREFLVMVKKIVRECFLQEETTADIYTFSDGRFLISDIGERRNYDIYLLDAEMKDMNGLQTAEQIRMRDRNAFIVSITSCEKYALQGYRYRVYSYVLKVQAAEKLPGVLHSICLERAQKDRVFYTIVNKRKYERFLINDILYLRKEGKNVAFYCRRNVIHEERGSLDDIFQKLPAGEFVYISRSNVIDLGHVTAVKDGNIELHQMILPISRYMITDVKRTLLEYWSRDGRKFAIRGQ